jgi:hypothetical protein
LERLLLDTASSMPRAASREPPGDIRAFGRILGYSFGRFCTFSRVGHKNMTKLRWIEEAEHAESLTTALRAVLALYGQDQPYENLLAALGLGTLVTAHPDEPLHHWPTLGRDLCLVDAAAKFGLSLRPLHPPDAAAGLGRSSEFASHFHDSYVPLIRTALAHEQLVLAWRGWPAPSSRCWGVIAGEQDEQLWGFATGRNLEYVPLIDPAHQAYVVEEYRSPGRSLNEIDLFDMVRRFAREFWEGSLTTMPGLLTGEKAYRAWIQKLRAPDSEESLGLSVLEQHRGAVRSLLAARRAMVIFLRGCARRRSAAAARWAESVERTIEILRPDEIVVADAKAALSPDWAEQASASLEAARDADSFALDESIG